MSHEQVRVGIAGLGRSRWNIHAPILEGFSDLYQVIAVVDQDPDRRQEAAEQFGCRVYGDYANMIDDQDVELIVVALPALPRAAHCAA